MIVNPATPRSIVVDAAATRTLPLSGWECAVSRHPAADLFCRRSCVVVLWMAVRDAAAAALWVRRKGMHTLAQAEKRFSTCFSLRSLRLTRLSIAFRSAAGNLLSAAVHCVHTLCGRQTPTTLVQDDS